MAEVGVLNLTIHDNSSEAAKGLNTLADALAAVRDAKKSFSLSGVAQSIKSLVDNVKSSTPVIGQLTKLFNSITAFSKLGEINIDVEKFAQLKQAVSGFSIGNSGSQMKALREALGGSWNTKSTDNAVTAMGKIRGTAEEWKANGTASSINAVAKAMKEYTEANSKLPADSPFTAVASQMQTEARTVTKATEQVKEAVGSWRDTGNGSYRGSDSGMTPSLMKRLSTQIYSSGPTGVQDMLRQVDQQVAGLEKVEETVHQATDAVTQYQASVSKTVEPVASMAEKSGACSDALANVNNEVVTASKSMDDISKQAFIATRNIQNLINTLNTKIDEKGFRNVVDALTGVSRVNTNLAETAAKSFDDKFFARADEIKAFIDMLNNPTGGKEWSSASFDQAMGLAEQTKDVINETNSMFTVPAMDEQGAFQTASEEVMRYTELLAKSRQELEFWDNEYARIQKQIKYNGSTPERMAELAQADKSGTFALAKVGEYETALRNVMDYAKSYSENMNAANQATGEQANAMDAVNNAAAGAGNRVKDIRSETEKLERDLQNVLAITSTWKTMMSDQKATIKEVYKNNPLVSGVIGKMSELKGEDMNSFIQSVNEIISQTSEASVKSEQLFALLNESAAVAPAMEKVADATGNTAASLNNLNKTGQSDFGQKAAMDAAKAFMAENSELELLQRRYDELLVKLGNGVMFGTMDTKEQLSTINELTRVGNKISALKAASQESIPALKDLDRELKQKKTDANEAASGFERFKAGLNHIKEGTKKLFSPLTKLGKQFVSIARRMAIRAVIRQFTSGLKEGLENLYNYSKAAKTSFAPAMDEAATSLQQMKNSLGAAVAPAIQALIPILQTVVNWVITGLNYLNQFFALLNGQKTWTRALPATTTAFGKQEKAAKGAAAAVKDLLADWDELNIIQSETGGGGSSGSGLKPEDYLKMFEEATIFDKEVTEVVGVIKENMSDVLNIVKEIGAAILLWKVSNAFAGTIGALTSILTLGVIVQLASDFTSVTNQAFIDTGNEFYLLADGIFTTALTAIGKKLADVKLGEGAGNIAGSIILAVSAGTTFAVSATEAMDESKRNMLTLVGAIKWGIASALAAAGLMKLGWGTLAAILGGTIGVTARKGCT